MLITTTDELIAFCDALSDAPYIAVDTEFLREKTYFAQLCLVQVAYGEHAAAIDPLSPDIDMRPLGELLLNEDVVKVLHSATQDLEIFLAKLGKVPTPIFDTQIAATVCGLGEQPGYAKLVSSMLGINLDKASQATDWSVRPLSDRQLDYALGDVTHLCRIYEKMLDQLEETGRSSWVAQDMEALHDEDRYRPAPREAWKKVRIRRPKRKTLAVLRELAAWREEVAIERNIPRNWIVRKEALIEIAQSCPSSAKELSRVRGLHERVARGRDGQAMLDAVEAALATPEETWPVVEKPVRRNRDHDDLVALLQALLQLQCSAHDVAPGLVVRKADLESLASGQRKGLDVLTGWRKEVFGDQAVKLCAGELALTGRKGDVAVVEV